MTDPLDNLKLPDIKNVHKNPYYDDIVKNGFSILVHYSPEDVAEILNGNLKFDFDIMEHSPDELAAFERYRKNHGVDDD